MTSIFSAGMGGAFSVGNTNAPTTKATNEKDYM